MKNIYCYHVAFKTFLFILPCCLVSKLCPTFLWPAWTVVRQVPLSIGFPGKNTRVVCHFLLQGIFLTQGSNLHLLHYQADSLLLLFSCSSVSYSLWPHGLQHTKLPCHSLSPGVCLNSCPLRWWCHLTISSSIALFCPQSLPALGCFPVSWLFTSRDQSIGLHLQPQSFQWIFRVDFLQPGLILLSKVDSLPLSYLGSPSR